MVHELASTDVLYGNLEGPLAGTDDPQPIPHKPGWVHSDPEMAAGLRAAGFSFMSCANNVTYPPEAALRSLAVLDANSIHHAGAGPNLTEARRPAIVERRGMRFGLLSIHIRILAIRTRSRPRISRCPGPSV